jgi:hypothetical protein
MDVVTLALAKKYALKMNNVGVESAISDGNGITWTLKDGTQLLMSINGWHNLTTDEQLVLSKFIPLSNDGGSTYFGTDLNRYPIDQSQTNNNKPYLFTSPMWIQDTIDTSKYTLTILHNLGALSIIPYVKNSVGKAETVGIDTSIENKIILESTIPFDGELVLNYSSSNGNKINSICTVNSSYVFTSNTDRDVYFQSSLSSLKNGLLIIVNDGVNKTLYTWEGLDDPSSYNNLLWNNTTALIKGETGLQGDKISHKWTNTILQLENVDGSWDSGVDLKGDSAYDIAVSEQSFSGNKISWLESLNSCLGKFTSLADLKIAYPVGIDKYKFAIIETVSGQVGIAFYESSAWDVTVFASTNGSSVVRDDKSISVNSMGNMELFGYEEANVDTIQYKSSDETIKYLAIEKNSLNAFTSIASKEYVNEIATGSVSLQDDYYNATTNIPDLSIVETDNKSYAWLCNVSGTQVLGGNSITLAVNDWIIKTSSGGFLKIDNSNTIVSWSMISGDITTQTDLINLLATYCKIDDIDTTSAIKTYSIKHILELLNGHRKIFIQSDSPVDMATNDLWLDVTNSPYTFSRYDGSVWRPIGKSAGTIINDWVASAEYKSGEYSIYNSLLYKCTTTNTDSVFTASNWNLIGGDVTTTGTQTLTNKTLDATNNTILNLNTTNFASGIIDTDGTLSSNSDTKIASEKAVKTYIGTIINTIYPVGHILMTENSANPNTYLGMGTWVAYGQGKVPVGVDSSQTEFNAIGQTGGEKQHILTVAEMPNHTHGYSYPSNTIVGREGGMVAEDTAKGTSYTTLQTSAIGGNTAHNNLQPYIVCYMWKRTV